MMKAILLCAVLSGLGCGPGAPGGPMQHGQLEAPDPSDEPAIQSNDIMAREAQSNSTKVQHILISWNKGPATKDSRAKERSREQADQLALQILERVRAGESMEELMEAHSEDPGSAMSGISYDVSPDAGLVFEFKRMGLRLKVDEAGLVLSDFGWHIIKRVE